MPQHLERCEWAVSKMQTTPPQKIGGGLAGNRDLKVYLEHKYVPSDKGRFSNTLEYAYDDWAVAQLAKALGKNKEYTQFLERSKWWRNAIDAETGFARLRKSDGRFEEDFDSFKSGANKQYVEGNAWQLTFFVPQDVGRGETFTIEAQNTSRKNKYVQHAVLNGERLDTFLFPASELLKGGKLILEMGREPNTGWGLGQLPN